MSERSPTVRECWRRNRRRGFVASLTAVTLIALVTVALTALVAASVEDARRTRKAGVDSELRQILLAGAAEATAKAGSWNEEPPSQSWPLTLPDALTEQGFRAQISMHPGASGQTHAVELEIEAASPTESRHRTLVFSRVDDRWSISEVQP